MSDQPIPQQEVDPVRGLVEALEPFALAENLDRKLAREYRLDLMRRTICAEHFSRAGTALASYRAWEEGGGSDSAAAPGRSGASAPPEGWGVLSALRSSGWSVAVHNDYRFKGQPHTFWLFTHPDGRWAKGEGTTDEEALSVAMLSAAPPPPAGVDRPETEGEKIAREALERIAEATPMNTNSRTSVSMASWTRAVASEAITLLAQQKERG